MHAVSLSDVQEWDGLIKTLARQRCKMVGIDFEDLCQEGYVSVVTSYAMGQVPTEQTIINQMRRYLRAIKGGRTVTYEPDLQSLLSL